MTLSIENGKSYEVEGATTGVLMFHAYTGSPNDFNFTARFLQRAGIEVFCPIFKGHGTDDIFDILEANPSIWWDETQEALSWMQQRNYEKIVVFGLSMGGIFVTRLLTENHADNLSGGVFNSPVYSAEPFDVEYFFEQYAQALFKKQGRSSQYLTLKSKIIEAYRAQSQELNYFSQSYRLALSDINGPFYIAQSEKDEMIVANDAFLLKEALINAEVDFNWFPDNTHVITTNRNRQEFEQSILNFIQR